MKYKNVYTKVNNLYEEYENNLDFDCICEDLGVYVYSANSCKFQDYKTKSKDEILKKYFYFYLLECRNTLFFYITLF